MTWYWVWWHCWTAWLYCHSLQQRAPKSNPSSAASTLRSDRGEVVYDVINHNTVSSPISTTSPQSEEDTYYIQQVDSVPDSRLPGSSPVPVNSTKDTTYHNPSCGPGTEENYSVASSHPVKVLGPNEYLQVLPPNNQYIQLLPPSTSGSGSPKPGETRTAESDLIYSFVDS